MGNDDGVVDGHRVGGDRRAPAATTPATEASAAEPGAEALRIVDLSDFVFDLARLGIAPVTYNYPAEVAVPLLDELALPPALLDELRNPATVVTGQGVYDVNLEALAALDPDLILVGSVFEGLFGDEVMANVREVAEVVVIPDDLGWRERTLAIGEAVGRTDAAQELIAEAERSLDELRASFEASASPGATVSVLWPLAPGQVAALVPPSISSQAIEAVGLARPAAQLVEQPEGSPFPDSGAAIFLSEEVLGDHDADVFIVLTTAEGQESMIIDQPALSASEAIAAGRVVTAAYPMWQLNTATGVEQMAADLARVQTLLG
ncbi:MAG: ABC transporter substrate-binding protein [Actinomycetota bacterium]